MCKMHTFCILVFCTYFAYANNWASEASPTLGCSIEISRDIYMSVGMSVVGQNALGGIKWPTRMLKVILGRLKLTCDTRVIHFDYTLEQL